MPGSTICLGDAADFSATLTLGSFPIASSHWDMGDGTTYDDTPGPDTHSHTYAAVGTYTVNLGVEDTNGWIGDAAPVVVKVMECHLPPVATFAMSGGGADCVDNRVFFDASASYDPDTGPVTFSWSFGDGSPAATGPTVEHQYASAAPVTVTLTVTDDEGASSVFTRPFPAAGDPNCPPLLQDLPEMEVRPGDLITFNLDATDADGPTLGFTGGALLGGILTMGPSTANVATATYTFTVGNLDSGSYHYPFRATDGIAFDEKELILHVRTATEDFDHDGVSDAADNCPMVANRDQADADRDGRGDACLEAPPPVADRDRDGVSDVADVCPDVPDPKQLDADGDGIGDECERLGKPDDADGDTILDGVDNCRARPNVTQTDLDADGEGDACDADADGDGIADFAAAGGHADNCLALPNADQKDSDGDGRGDACDDITPTPVGLHGRSASLSRSGGGIGGAWALFLIGFLATVAIAVVPIVLVARKRRKDQQGTH